MENLKARECRLDVLKGIAIILVVLGHILQFCYDGFSSLLIFNIIWSLQIPLFMVVSGYFAGGNKPITTTILNKARAYLIPVVSVFLIRELVVLGNYDLIDRIQQLLFNIENTLWYLFVLFELSMVHLFAVKIAKKISKTHNSIAFLFKYSIFYGLFLMPFAALAVTVGTTFLGVKYVLYYSLFYWLGFVWRALSQAYEQQSDSAKKKIKTIINAATLLAFVIYIVSIANWNLYEVEDNLVGIIIRFITGVSGVLIVVRSVWAFCNGGGKVEKALSFVGQYTLEIYYIHYIFIQYMAKFNFSISSPMGILSLVVSLLAVLFICAVLIIVINCSPWTAFVIFGKKTRK